MDKHLVEGRVFHKHNFEFALLCLVFVMLSRLFIAALWSPAAKAFVVTFPCSILGQV